MFAALLLAGKLAGFPTALAAPAAAPAAPTTTPTTTGAAPAAAPAAPPTPRDGVPIRIQTEPGRPTPAPPGTRTRFTGRDEDVALADAAWDAARVCAARDPVAPAVVPILRDLDEDPRYGAMNGIWDGARIRLQPNARPSTIAHEVGHLWIHDGIPALVEGRTELLTACVQRARPDLFVSFRDLHTDLEGMLDLPTWRRRLDHDRDAVAKSYIASFRLFRSLAAVVPAETLFRGDIPDWDALIAVVEAAGPAAAPAVAALRADAETRRQALVDHDRDGVPTLLETLTGTNPQVWDSDGDGWWDGAPEDRPANAQPFPKSEHPICLTHVPAEGPILLERGGQLAGMDMAPAVNWAVKRGTTLKWDGTWYFFPGGTWVRPLGGPLVPNPQCAMHPGLTVRSAVELGGETLVRLAAAADEALDAYARLGVPRPASVVVSVVEEATWVEAARGEVLVPVALAERVDARSLGRQAAALAAFPGLYSHHRGAAAAALVQTALPDAPTAELGVPPYDRAPWLRAVKRCLDGWEGVLDKTCKSPLTE